jgi:hypothetical protein
MEILESVKALKRWYEGSVPTSFYVWKVREYARIPVLPLYEELRGILMGYKGADPPHALYCHVELGFVACVTKWSDVWKLVALRDIVSMLERAESEVMLEKIVRDVVRKKLEEK